MSEYIIKNAYGTDVPPWSAVEITGIANESGRSVYTVTRPTVADLPAGKVLFSGACAIPAGGYGIGYSAFDSQVFANGTPDRTTGYCGVAANSFDLSGTQSGFVSPGGSGKIAVRPFSGSVFFAYDVSLYDFPEIHYTAYEEYAVGKDKDRMASGTKALTKNIVLKAGYSYALYGLLENEISIHGGDRYTETGPVARVYFSDVNGENHRALTITLGENQILAEYERITVEDEDLELNGVYVEIWSTAKPYASIEGQAEDRIAWIMVFDPPAHWNGMQIFLAPLELIPGILR